MYYYPYYFDFTYIFILIGAAICLLASSKLNSTVSKYSQLRNSGDYTGADVAKAILRANGIYDVTVQHIEGDLTDHYDPRTKTVNLSDAVFNATTVTALGVAAHECGHALQDANEYFPLKFRSAFVPIANFGSKAAWPLIILGIVFGGSGSLLCQIGIVCFSLAVLFQLITLPVEYNASGRALTQLETLGLVTAQEKSGAKAVLSAAALTYVAAAASSILQLLRLVLIFGGGNRRRR